VTNVPDDPSLPVRRHVVEGVRALLDTFGSDDGEPKSDQSADQLVASLQNLQEDPPKSTTYLMIAFASATIRWAAHETGRSETDILNELASGFGVT
jgi:hypothetical protein